MRYMHHRTVGLHPPDVCSISARAMPFTMPYPGGWCIRKDARSPKDTHFRHAGREPRQKPVLGAGYDVSRGLFRMSPRDLPRWWRSPYGRLTTLTLFNASDIGLTSVDVFTRA